MVLEEGGSGEEEGGREDKGRCDMMDTYTQNNGACVQESRT